MSGAILNDEHAGAPLLGCRDGPVFRLGDRVVVTVFGGPRHGAFYFNDRANATAMRLREHQARHGRISGVFRDA